MINAKQINASVRKQTKFEIPTAILVNHDVFVYIGNNIILNKIYKIITYLYNSYSYLNFKISIMHTIQVRLGQ